jgi:putative transcriptional regulator
LLLSLFPRVAIPFVLAILLGTPGPAPAADSLAGQLLVAAPGMSDPRFAETVILVVRHDNTGAMGIVINRPVAAMSLDDLLSSIGQPPVGAEEEIVIHTGGPMQQQVGFLLHSPDYKTEGTLRVTDQIAMTSRPEMITDMAAGKGPRQFLLAFGYAGWGPGQLEGEMMHGDWFAVPTDTAIVFDDDDSTKWQRASERRGVDL